MMIDMEAVKELTTMRLNKKQQAQLDEVLLKMIDATQEEIDEVNAQLNASPLAKYLPMLGIAYIVMMEMYMPGGLMLE